jgi:hypothetical protein
MSGAYQKQTRALMLPMLKAWMGEIACILSPPVPSENTDDWGLRTEVWAEDTYTFSWSGRGVVVWSERGL